MILVFRTNFVLHVRAIINIDPLIHMNIAQMLTSRLTKSYSLSHYLENRPHLANNRNYTIGMHTHEPIVHNFPALYAPVSVCITDLFQTEDL